MRDEEEKLNGYTGVLKGTDVLRKFNNLQTETAVKKFPEGE